MDTDFPVLSQIDTNENSTNSSLSWDKLTDIERRIIIAVVYEGTPEEARKKLVMTHSTFYRKWARLKDYYSELILEFPKKVSYIKSHF